MACLHPAQVFMSPNPPTLEKRYAALDDKVLSVRGR